MENLKNFFEDLWDYVILDSLALLFNLSLAMLVAIIITGVIYGTLHLIAMGIGISDMAELKSLFDFILSLSFIVSVVKSIEFFC